MEEEIWKPIWGWYGYYEASSFGRIRSVDRTIVCKLGITYKLRGHLLRPGNNKGYLCCVLHSTKKRATQIVSRLVAKTFIPNPFRRSDVNHIDGNKLNNAISNLEWKTHRANNLEARKMGLCPVFKGTDNGRCKLLEEDVLDIRRLYADGTTVPEIHKKYSMITTTTIHHICKRKLWKHI